MSRRLLCPGWPKGPCGQEAGTAWTNTYCERCDEKRRDYIAAAVGKNILEPTVVETASEPAPTWNYNEVSFSVPCDVEAFGLARFPEYVALWARSAYELANEMRVYWLSRGKMPDGFALPQTDWLRIQDELDMLADVLEAPGPFVDPGLDRPHFLFRGVPIVSQDTAPDAIWAGQMYVDERGVTDIEKMERGI